MSIRSSYSTQKEISLVIKDLQTAFDGQKTSLIIYFASSAYDMGKLSAALQAAFPAAQSLGCSTAGEITAGKMLKNSLVAMAFDRETVADAALAIVEDGNDPRAIQRALDELAAHFKTPLLDLDLDRYAGIVLVDGLSGSEERLMELLGDRCDIPFTGGSAGDDLKFKHTSLALNGKLVPGTAVLALLDLPAGYRILKTQSFSASAKKLTATAVDEATRTVLEFNNQPAVAAYAEALGVPPSGLADQFMHAPLGLLVDGEPYVRSPQQVKGSHVVFYCNIKKGTELNLLTSGDIVTQTQADLQALSTRSGPFAGILNFNCILRTLELEKKDQCQAYADVFSAVPTTGFSTYGEAYIGHMNQTATMLLFK